MTSLTPPPIALIDCDRHHLRLTELACLKFGQMREDCQGCAISDHIAGDGKKVNANAWSTKYAAYLQSRAKHMLKMAENKEMEGG